MQGRDLDSARKMVWDAQALADAGVFSIVLECVPGNLAEVVTDSIIVPTIGIGAGPGCDGQVLVTHDLLGMFDKFIPSFVKKYANLAPEINKAVAGYCEEVRKGVFPDEEHTFSSNVDLGPLLEEKDS